MPDLAIALGYRSCLFVPLLKDGKALGSLTILRETTGEFDAQEIALAQTFADQAVIAIENARLFNETQGSARAADRDGRDPGVISESPTDVQPVFEAIAATRGRSAEACRRRCSGSTANTCTAVASDGTTPARSSCCGAGFRCRPTTKLDVGTRHPRSAVMQTSRTCWSDRREFTDGATSPGAAVFDVVLVVPHAARRLSAIG